MDTIPNGGKNLRGRVCLNIVATRHHDETHNPNEQHQGHTLRPTPRVQYLCQGNFTQTSNDIGHDTRGSRQRVELECTGHVGV